MSKISKKLTTNARILKDVLTHYSSTFNAFKELINNSLQAHARNIYIELRASECDEDSVRPEHESRDPDPAQCRCRIQPVACR